MTVEGVKTTIPFLLKVLAHTEFRTGNVDTSFVETHRGRAFQSCLTRLIGSRG